MIKRKDLEEFFDLEAEATKKSWEDFMKLPIKDRIRKRRAIQNVFLDKNFSGNSDENYRLLKVSCKINLSDFKEGDYLLLHKENSLSGIKCRLTEFIGDDEIILDVFPRDMPTSIDDYHDIPLVLDKDKVDLRDNVYSPFIWHLARKDDDFWNNHLINNPRDPLLDNIKECEELLKQTITSFEINLLEKQKEAVLKSMMAQDYYLIQGPPGTGKSYVLGLIMLEELFDLKHNIIVIGPNHKAINNAMSSLIKILPASNGSCIKVGQTYNKPEEVKVGDENAEIVNITHLNVSRFKTYLKEQGEDIHWLIGLTPHSLYTSRARGLECDTLIIDEAGQMTIPLTLMGMIKAKKVILAGDHKQLSPIISSERISDELRDSAFKKIIKEGNYTMLDTSFRMCQPICQFVSDLFYEGELKAIRKGNDNDLICEEPLYSFDYPVILYEVEDEGEQFSDKEAEFISMMVAEFLNKGIEASEIGILSPFRAQATNIRRHIRKNKDISEEAKKELVSETIDKMQGQERKVIIYSLVSGNKEYMQEMAEFLYNPNKMNVAFSRAKSKLIIVGSLSKLESLDLPEYKHLKKMMESKHVKNVTCKMN